MHSSESVIKGILSDSITSIECIFVGAFARQYEKEHGIKIQEGTKGAVIKLLEFEVVVPYEPSETALYITKFEINGCEGSGTFGNPRKIKKNKVVSALAKDLRLAVSIGQIETDGEAEQEDVDDHGDSSSVRSQSSDMGGDLQPASQEACLTQIPSGQAAVGSVSGAQLPPISRPKPRADDLLKNLAVKKTTATDLRPDNSSRQREQSVSGEKRTHLASRTSTPIREEELARRPARPSETGQISMIDTRSPATYSRPASRGSCEGRASPTAPLPVKQGNDNGPENSDSNDSTRLANASNNEKHAFRSASLSSRSRQVFAEQATPSHHPNTDRTRVGTSNHDGQRPEESGSNNFWKHIKKITRRDILIPRDQEEMIESPDSWVPPEAGKPMPQAHVPVDLLRQWNEHETMRANARASTPSRQATFEEQQLDSSMSTSPGTPLDEEWPPSPPSQRNNIVPPDSSPLQRITRPSMAHRSLSSQKSTHEEGLDTQWTVDNEEDAGPDVSSTSNNAPLPENNPLPIVEECNTDSEMETGVPGGFGQSVFLSTNDSSNPVSSAPVAKDDLSQANQSTMTNSSCSQGHLPTTEIQVPRSDNRRRAQALQIPSDSLVPGTYDSGNMGSQSQSQFQSQPQSQSQSQSEHFEVTQEDNTKNPMDQEEDMIMRQLNSELDSSVLSSQAPGQQDPFKTGLTRSQNTDGSSNQRELVEVPVSSIETEEPHPAATTAPNKRKRNESDSDRPAKLQRTFDQKPFISIDAAKHTTIQERTSLDADNRLSFFSVEPTISPGQVIYDSFKQAYPEYEGNIKVFKRTCRTLQALNVQGDMRRTVLWDDFIVRESGEYQNYILECLRREESPVSYKTYFLDNVDSVRLKKRNLSGKKVATVVNDDTIDDSTDPESQLTNGDIPSLENSQPEYSSQLVLDNASVPVMTPTQVVSDIVSEKATEEIVEEVIEEVAEQIPEALGVHDKKPLPPTGSPDRRLDIPRDSSKRNLSADSEDFDDQGWEECDDTHEIASVDLGDDSRIMADKEVASDDSDIEMEDQASLSSADEERYAAVAIAEDSAISRSLSFHEVSEIEESDVDDSLMPAQHDTSPRPARQSSNVPFDSIAGGKPPELSEKAKGKQKSPGLGDSLYPPYQPAPLPEAPADSREEHAKSHVKPRPWWKYPNTQFKDFARAYTSLKSELGSWGRPHPVDEDGVIKPDNRGPRDGPVQGRMNSMGWRWYR